MSGFSNFSTLTVGNPYRTQRNLHLTLLSESWQLDVCCPLNTFVPVASARTPLGIMGLPHPSIHTSQARFVVMQVRLWLFHVVLSETNPLCLFQMCLSTASLLQPSTTLHCIPVCTPNHMSNVYWALSIADIAWHKWLGGPVSSSMSVLH
jgi:hypothetical protein